MGSNIFGFAKKLDKNTKLPVYKTLGSSGMDVVANNKKKIIKSRWEVIFALPCVIVRFLCICVVAIFKLIVGIAFGRPSAPIWDDFGVKLGSFTGHFAHVFADAAKLYNATPLKRKPCFGECRASHFAYFSLPIYGFVPCCCLEGILLRF